MHSGVIAGSKLASGLAVAKLLAVYGGPAGFAQFAQFQNLVQMGGGIAGGGIGQGLIRHLAESEDREHRWRYLTAGFSLGLALTMLAVGIVLLIGFFVGDRLFAADVFAWSVLAAVALCMVSIINLAMSSLNGLGKSGWMAWGQGAGALVTIAGAWWLMRDFGALGGGAGMLLGGMVAALIAVSGLWRVYPDFMVARRNVKRDELRSLLRYVAMSIGAATTFPVALMVVRTMLGETVSWDEAGQWSALWRLSEVYLLVVTTLMSVYYLPRLARASSPQSVKNEINQGILRFIPLAIVLALLAYSCAEWTVVLFLSEKFNRIQQLLGVQIVGDSIKIAAWLHGNYFWARGDASVFIMIQVVFSASFALFCWIGIGLMHSAEGCVLGYVMNSIAHFLVVRALVMHRIGQEAHG